MHLCLVIELLQALDEAFSGGWRLPNAFLFRFPNFLGGKSILRCCWGEDELAAPVTLFFKFALLILFVFLTKGWRKIIDENLCSLREFGRHSKDTTVDSDWKCRVIFFFFFPTYFFLPEENAVGLFWRGPFYLYSMRVLGPVLSLFLGTRFLGMHSVMKMLLFAAQVYCYPWRNFSLYSPFFFFFLIELLEGDWSVVVDQSFRKWAKKKTKQTHVGCMFLTLSVFERWGDKFADSSN